MSSGVKEDIEREGRGDESELEARNFPSKFIKRTSLSPQTTYRISFYATSTFHCLCNNINCDQLRPGEFHSSFFDTLPLIDLCCAINFVAIYALRLMPWKFVLLLIIIRVDLSFFHPRPNDTILA
jgi:hypothetical protein